MIKIITYSIFKNTQTHFCIVCLLLLMAMCNPIFSQQPSDSIVSDTTFQSIANDTNDKKGFIDISRIKTRRDVQRLTMEQLLSIPFDQLIRLAEKLEISIEELLSMPTQTSGKVEQTPREANGILSIITDEEIRASGARDLIDILRLVPGYSFGYDLQGVIGVGTRGLWGHEGKILLLIDGQEMNELYYNTIPFGNHYPIENIQRIEIIRGPGSSIYGGSAELGVINIITKSGEDLMGVSETKTYGRMTDTHGRANINMAVGHKIKDFDFAISGTYSDAQKTTLSQAYLSDTTIKNYDYSNGVSKTNNQHLNANFKYKGLKTSFIWDDYTTGFISGYGDVMSNRFTNYLFDTRYDYKISDEITITPRFNYKNNTPWYNDSVNTNKKVEQYIGGIQLKYENSKVSLLAGTEQIIAKGFLLTNVDTFFNGKKDISFFSQAYYLQSIFKTEWFNITIGGRFDKFNYLRQDTAGMYYYSNLYQAFSPRLGITKAYDNFHYKVLISKAFKAPSIGNINFNPNVEPENTKIYEFEAGYKLNKRSFITVNLFNSIIEDPIIFRTIYFNFSKIGSRGGEIEYKYKAQQGFLTLNYSYYKNTSDDKMFYRVKEDTIKKTIDTVYIWNPNYYNQNRLLGFPNHKITALLCLNLTKKISVSNTFILMSSYYAYDLRYKQKSNGTEFVDFSPYKFSPGLIWNFYIEYKNLLKGLDFGFGIFDVFQQNPSFPQPYRGGLNPFPAMSREYVFKIRYNFQFANEE